MTPALYHRGQNDKWSPEQGTDELGIDWLSVTLPEEHEPELRARVWSAELAPPERQNGRHGFETELRYPSGTTISAGHPSGRCMLNVPGGACSWHGSAWLCETAAYLLDLAEDVRFTRVDIRRDQVGDRQTLIDDVIGACERGELRFVRGFKKFVERDADTQALLGHGVYLGSTKSKRFVRCYDKGLETKLQPAGVWVRFEAQLREEFADQAVRGFCRGGGAWLVSAFHILASVADFVPAPRGSSAHWDRYPRSKFWSEFRGGDCNVRGSGKRRHPDVVSHLFWLYQSLGQLQAACDELGISLGTAIDRLVGRAADVQEAALVPHLVAALLERSTVVSSPHGQDSQASACA